jgi:SOS-response transcriptional repressor LexA
MLKNGGENTMKETLGQRIKRLREARGLNRYRLGKYSGINSGYITRIEEGEFQPGIEILKKLAKGLNVPLSTILDDNPEEPAIEKLSPEERIENITSDLVRLKIDLKNQIKIPILGIIPASYPCLVEESYEGDITLQRELLEGISNPEKLFALRVSGPSLIGDGILPGDIILFTPAHEIDIEGKIYACRIENECTAKHARHANGKIRLYASNDDYKDFEPRQVEIRGRAVKRIGDL